MHISLIRSLRTALALGFVILLVSACGNGVDISPEKHVTRAKAHQAEGDLPAAIIELKNAVSKSPDNAEARRLLGELYVQVGEGAGAEKELRRAIELGIAPEDVTVALTRAALLQGKHQEIVDEVLAETIGGTQASAALPENARAELLALRGHAFFGADRRDAAESLYDEALLLEPENLEARLGKARLAALSGEIEKSRKDLEDLLANNSDFAPAWSLLGALENGEGRLVEAEHAYGKAIENRFNNLPDLLQRALIRIALADYDGAAKDIKELKERSPNHPGMNYANGVLAFAQERYAEAQTSFQDALKASPDFMDAVYYLGLSHYRKGDLEQAAEHLSRVLRTYPRSVEVAKLLGTVRLLQSDYAGAEAVLNRALALNPDDAETLTLLSQVAIPQGKTKVGVAYLEKVAAEQKESPIARMNLGLGLLAEDKEAQAIDELEAAIQLEPQMERADVLIIQSHLRAGRLDEALEAAERFRGKHPQRPLPLNFIGLIHLQRGEGAKAREVFNQALKFAPGDPAATNNLALMALNKGDIDEARQLYEASLKHHPGDLRILMQLTALETRARRIQAAKQWLEIAADQNPNALQPRLHLARYYLNTGQPEQALVRLQEVQDVNSDNPAFLTILGEAQMAAGQPARAAGTLERLTKAQPNWGYAYYLLASAQLGSKDLAGARRSLEKSISLNPELLSARLMHARLLMTENRVEEANQQLAELEQFHQNHPEVFGLKGWLALQQGRPEDAMKAFQEARKRGQTSKLIQDIAAAQWNARDWAGSLATQEEWLKNHPQDIQVRYNVAQEYMMLQINEEAKSHLAAVVEQSPDHAGALNNLAWLLRKDDPDAALRYAERAVALAPDNPSLMDTLGVILLEQGDTERALRRLRAASEKSPESLQIRYHLAKALAESGQRSQARTILEEILSEQKTFLEITEAQALLKELGG